MTPQEKTITIDGKQVRMRYCLGAECTFERMTGHSIGVFWPTFKKEGDSFIIDKPATADRLDNIYLGYACILAAYENASEEAPFKDSYLLYDAPSDVYPILTAATTELLVAYYSMPDVIKTEEENKQKGESKNV